mgnify:FL=1
MRCLFYSFCLLFFFEVIAAQDGVLLGSIYDVNGNSLPGANIIIEKINRGVAANKEGKYQLKGIPRGPHVVRVMYIGHRTIKKDIVIESDQKLILNFQLERSMIDLDEIVVSASFSERKKRAQASPVTVISEEELRRLPVRSVDEVLLGKVPGGYASLPHRPGQNNYAFTLRGGTSGSGGPLGDVKIYVDGVELLGFDVQSYPGIADFIDPSDIERVEVLRGPMGSTLHGSNAQSGIIHIFTKRGSSSSRNVWRVKLAQKNTDAPILGKNVPGQEFSVNFNGRSSSDISFNVGANRTVDEEVMPNNGQKVEQLKLHAAINVRIGPAVVDLKTFQSWGTQGHINNLYHLLEYQKNRGWANAPSHWDFIPSDGTIAYYKPGFSFNYIQNFNPKLYHNLVIGNDTRQSLFKKRGSEGGEAYLKHDWNRTTMNYFWHGKKSFPRMFEIDITAGTQRTESSNVRLSGSLDESKSQYYYDDFEGASLVDQSYINWGYYAEAVFGYKDQLFITLGERIEENEYFGKDYGRHISPRLGFSYVMEFNSFIWKARAAWGSGGINPPQAMQALPSESQSSINIGNPNLRPERQSGYEIGGDFYLGDNLFFEITYYDQIFLDGIQNDPSIDDLETIKQEYWYINFGEIINKGWEFSAKTRIGPLDLNATYSITDSRWGQDSIRQNDIKYEGFFDEGVRRNDVPKTTGNLSFSCKIPSYSSKSSKGGNFVLDFNYTGEKKGRDWLLYYDGLYNPDITPYTYYSKDLIKNYKPYFLVRLRCNYWVTTNANFYLDIRNLTEHKDISRGITQPALGRQVTLGIDLEF